MNQEPTNMTTDAKAAVEKLRRCAGGATIYDTSQVLLKVADVFDLILDIITPAPSPPPATGEMPAGEPFNFDDYILGVILDDYKRPRDMREDQWDEQFGAIVNAVERIRERLRKTPLNKNPSGDEVVIRSVPCPPGLLEAGAAVMFNTAVQQATDAATNISGGVRKSGDDRLLADAWLSIRGTVTRQQQTIADLRSELEKLKAAQPVAAGVDAAAWWSTASNGDRKDVAEEAGYFDTTYLASWESLTALAQHRIRDAWKDIAPAPTPPVSEGGDEAVAVCGKCGRESNYGGTYLTDATYRCDHCEVERLRSKTITCCFCNHPCESLAALKEHSATCGEHPAVREVAHFRPLVESALHFQAEIGSEYPSARKSLDIAMRVDKRRIEVEDELFQLRNSLEGSHVAAMVSDNARLTAELAEAKGLAAGLNQGNEWNKKEIARLKECNQRLEQACDVFEQNSADAVEREQRIQQLESELATLTAEGSGTMPSRFGDPCLPPCDGPAEESPRA